MLKKFFLLLFTLLLVTGTAMASNAPIYVIPVKGDINAVTYSIVKDGIKQATEDNAAAIVFEIDTYGGYIHSAEMIKNEIINSELPTIAFVNNKAESAGVLIAISAEKLVMNRTATMGSAETVPNNEKNMSLWLSMLRDTAQYRERDEKIVISMADSNQSIDGLVGKGKLLNLTAKEAESIGFVDGIAGGIPELLEKSGISYGSIVESEISLRNSVAKTLTNPIINTLLLIVGFVGAVVELFMPGFGAGGILSILGFGLFFAGNIISGNAELASLLLFILGGILIFIEMLIPGFGFPGILGIALLIIGLVLAMKDLVSGLFSLSIAIITASIVGTIIVKQGFSSPLFKTVVLTKHLETESSISPQVSYVDIIGKVGRTVTILRPSGTIDIEGVRFDVLTEGDFIPKDTEVEILRVVGSKIFVRRK